MENHDCYADIIGNIFRWKCYVCKKRLNWFKVFKLGRKQYGEDWPFK